ncbi:putative quinol monooxygenase [Chitinophaga pinensis]|uniref:Antibiotic biosynthesis monooxygenase n=1 Tax=Chitinophaga pinensis (strain ATCC 43595 / DSM 2588 / LMG 13176 / NBRC 15968 / NCIMB 11800 / UQM 2034) TaxID=485918 RepID=A0A979G7Q1_CHIPD|nr:putative quinol monooxygenase [Chitinophaga pinensis]ACU62232.1 Antibiotic biosynthesis monooxygenase [Chitinophaga pinensis DSM 2588]
MEREIIVKWKIKASATQEILALLPALAEQSKHEPGNLGYHIYQSESDPNELILHERYVDADAAEAHRNSAHYQEIVVGKVVPHLEVREVIIVKKLL